MNHTAQVSFDNYKLSGDVASIAICVVIFILWALVAAILPNLVNCIIGVALLFLWIGYKLRS